MIGRAWLGDVLGFDQSGNVVLAVDTQVRTFATAFADLFSECTRRRSACAEHKCRHDRSKSPCAHDNRLTAKDRGLARPSPFAFRLVTIGGRVRCALRARARRAGGRHRVAYIFIDAEERHGRAIEAHRVEFTRVLQTLTIGVPPRGAYRNAERHALRADRTRPHASVFGGDGRGGISRSDRDFGHTPVAPILTVLSVLPVVAVLSVLTTGAVLPVLTIGAALPVLTIGAARAVQPILSVSAILSVGAVLTVGPVRAVRTALTVRAVLTILSVGAVLSAAVAAVLVTVRATSCRCCLRRECDRAERQRSGKANAPSPHRWSPWKCAGANARALSFPLDPRLTPMHLPHTVNERRFKNEFMHAPMMKRRLWTNVPWRARESAPHLVSESWERI